MRSLPNFKVFVASDAVQTDWIVRHAIEDAAPMYLRLSRDIFPDLYREGENFVEGKGRVARESTDVTVIACGIMVSTAIQVAKQMSEENISVRVVDMFCIKPLDQALVIKCAIETGAIISAEEHNIIGGLGSTIAETLCRAGKQVPMTFVGTQDVHGECGPYHDLLHKYGLDAEAIAQKNSRGGIKEY